MISTKTLMIVCSAPRTGSTLVWQVASRLLPDETVEKFHGPEMLEFMESHPESKEPVIIPQRNKVDAYLSMLRTCGFDGEEEPWLEAIKAGDMFTHVESFKRELSCIEQVIDTYQGRMLLLDYETFAKNWRVWLIHNIAKFAGVSTSLESRKLILEETSIEANRERQAKLSGFSEYDPVSKIHGRHIYTGSRTLMALRLVPHIVKLTEALNPVYYERQGLT